MIYTSKIYLKFLLKLRNFEDLIKKQFTLVYIIFKLKIYNYKFDILIIYFIIYFFELIIGVRFLIIYLISRILIKL